MVYESKVIISISIMKLAKFDVMKKVRLLVSTLPSILFHKYISIRYEAHPEIKFNLLITMN